MAHRSGRRSQGSLQPNLYGRYPGIRSGRHSKIYAPVENPDYQIRAIKIGGILIADRNLVFLISWDDLDKQGFC